MGSSPLLTLGYSISNSIYTPLKGRICQHLFLHSFDYAAFRAILFHFLINFINRLSFKQATPNPNKLLIGHQECLACDYSRHDEIAGR